MVSIPKKVIGSPRPAATTAFCAQPATATHGDHAQANENDQGQRLPAAEVGIDALEQPVEHHPDQDGTELEGILQHGVHEDTGLILVRLLSERLALKYEPRLSGSRRMKTTERRITGVDGISLFCASGHRIRAAPSEPKAVIQFLHGQGEYGGRYAHLAEFLTDQGYIIYVSDHRGHGRTVFEQPEDARDEHRIPGHMADKDGWQKCLDDQEIVRRLIREEQPGLPLILAGHSLGSLMIQDMLIQDSHRWDLAVLMSSRGGRPDLNERALEIAVLFQFLIGRRAQPGDLDRLPDHAVLCPGDW